MKKNVIKSTISILLAVMLVFSSPLCVFAANSEDVIVIEGINLTNVATPYAGENPQYTCEINTDAYYFDGYNDGDDVINGQWWYDETIQRVVQPDETFIEGHIYAISILLHTTDGYEFKVDENNENIARATVNGNEAIVVPNGKYMVFVEYSFEPCYENPVINEIELNVTEPVAGEYPDFYPELLTQGVAISDLYVSDYINGVAWYDCTNNTFMNFSDKFEEGHVYEINVAVETLEDMYFPTDANGNAAVVGYVNGNKATTETAGETGRYYARICYAFGDNRHEVSNVDVTGITTPSVGATPDFSVAETSVYYINGVYWTDVTTSSHVNLKETDVFEAGHTYELEVWLRASTGYKFKVDSDDFVDITATVGGKNAEAVGNEVAVILTVTYRINAPQVVSFVDIGEVEEPVAGETPDITAFCYTQGCNVDTVAWYDITGGSNKLMTENEMFVAGKSYRVVVSVVAEGNATFCMVDGYNEATGAINGERANAFGSHDDRYVEFYYNFAPCQNGGDSFTLGDVDGNGKITVMDATAIQQYLAKMITLDETQLLAADTSKDSKISILDATNVQMFIAKIIDKF